ncbi:hypothetical protein ACKX2L_00450 [Lachnospiraceae bacterium YH-ros2228]|jgi:hypothetical protein|nr:hypothetical protein [Lachnospiraceae bacterium]
MDNRDKWRLCGGTFFILISNARKQMISKGEMYAGKKSGITEPETLMALARIITPDIQDPEDSENKSMRDGTLKFKSCATWGWRPFLFNDKAAKKSFDERIKNDYQGCLAQMTEFTNKYLDLRTDTHKDFFLVKALLELLDADRTIDGDTKFYTEKSGETITKDELLGQTTICLESFLLGLWHYCIVEVKKNSIGQETYKEWCPPTEGNNERPYEACVGEDSDRQVKLTYSMPSEFMNYEDKKAPDEASDPEPERIGSVYESKENAQQNLEQTINQPKVFNFRFEQSGNGTQIGYVEHFHGKKED